MNPNGPTIEEKEAMAEQLEDMNEAWLKERKLVALQCNECGKKRKVSADGNYNERCPKCGGVDWDVL